MPTITPAVRSHLWRLVRMPAFTSAAALLIVPLIHAAVIRWPAIGGIVALLEIVVRTIAPTVPAPPPGPAAPRVPPPA